MGVAGKRKRTIVLIKTSLMPKVALWLVCAAFGTAAVGSSVAACERADFEQAVGSASTTLRDMTNRNTPDFQDRLRALKTKRGWSTDEFVKAAAPLVADDKIAEFNCFVSFTTHQKKSECLVDDIVACNDWLVKRVEPFNCSLMIWVLCDKKREPYAGVNEYHVQFP